MTVNHCARSGSKYRYSGKSIDLLHNNCMLSVLEEAILMSTHNIQFHNEIRKLP